MPTYFGVCIPTPEYAYLLWSMPTYSEVCLPTMPTHSRVGRLDIHTPE